MENPADLKHIITLLQERERVLPAKKIMEDLTCLTDECACGKMCSPLKFSPLHTGVMQVLNNVCPGCKDGAKADKELSKIVCVGCRKVVLRPPPFRDPDGFTYVAGKTYHTENCPVCKPDIVQSLIIEKVLYMKKQGKTI